MQSKRNIRIINNEKPIDENLKNEIILLLKDILIEINHNINK